jgi:4-hydroxy-tetrahydrodipicolinate reductase
MIRRSWRVYITMVTRLCVVGATGKFGRMLLSNVPPDFRISGAFARNENPLCGRTLKEAGIGESDAIIEGVSRLPDRVNGCDMMLFVSNPQVDVANVHVGVEKGKKIVIGTTGFDKEQESILRTHLSKVPSLVAPNFSIGANILFLLSGVLSRFASEYQFTVIEHHHTAKRDAPSGTARAIVNALDPHSRMRVITDRTTSPRSDGEIEVYSVRGGTVPGIHRIIASGEDEFIELGHTAFSRKAFVRGCYAACRWLTLKDDPGVYTMRDVLG